MRSRKSTILPGGPAQAHFIERFIDPAQIAASEAEKHVLKGAAASVRSEYLVAQLVRRTERCQPSAVEAADPVAYFSFRQVVGGHDDAEAALPQLMDAFPEVTA